MLTRNVLQLLCHQYPRSRAVQAMTNKVVYSWVSHGELNYLIKGAKGESDGKGINDLCLPLHLTGSFRVGHVAYSVIPCKIKGVTPGYDSHNSLPCNSFIYEDLTPGYDSHNSLPCNTLSTDARVSSKQSLLLLPDGPVFTDPDPGMGRHHWQLWHPTYGEIDAYQVEHAWKHLISSKG